MSEKALLHAENYTVTENTDAEGEISEQQSQSNGLTIEGMAMPFGQRSRNGVKYDTDSIKSNAESMIGNAILFNHDEDEPLGHVTEVKVKDDGLYYEGDINPERRESESLKRGDIPHVSIQAMVEEMDNTDKTGKVAVTEFLELSAVTVPGFPQTDVQTGEAIAIESLVEKEGSSFESLEDPEFSVGDFVEWEFGDGTSQGEVIDMTAEVGDSMSAGGNTFTIEEDDGPLYKMQEWDEDAGENGEFTNNVVKFEEALSTDDRPDEAPSSAPRNESFKKQEAFEFSPVPTHVLYSSKQDALLRAKRLGLQDVHRHVLGDGEEQWMAGATHEEWVQAIQDNIESYNDKDDDEDEDTSAEPFAGYDDFDDCVSQNQDKNDPEAYCAAIKRKVETGKDLKEAVDDVDTTPTQEMAEIASTVLEKVEDSSLDNDECGTRIGLERANQLENREQLSADTINRMVSFFSRHEGDQEVDSGVDSKWEDCGYVTWQMWGGNPGREWAERKQDEIEDAKEEILGEKSNMNDEKLSERIQEQLEEVAEDDFTGTVADMYEELSASDAASLMDEFTFTGNPEPLVAQLADVAGVTPADLMEVLESEMEGTHHDDDDMEDDEDEGTHDDMDDEDDKEESLSEASNKNNGSEKQSQSGDNSMSKSREELQEKIDDQESRIEELEEMIEKLEDTEGSKQATGTSTSESSEVGLNPEFEQKMEEF